MPYPKAEVRQDGKDLYAEAERLGLRSKQRDFALAFIADPSENRTLAAKTAGYGSPHVAGCNLLKQPKVKAFIDFARSKDVQGVQRKLGAGSASRQETLRIMSEQMRGGLIEYLKDDGSLDLARLKEDRKGYLLKEWQVSRRKINTPNGDVVIDESVRGKAVDPGQAARLMAQHHRLIDQEVKPVQVANYTAIIGKLDKDAQEALRHGLGALYGTMLGEGAIDVEAQEA